MFNAQLALPGIEQYLASQFVGLFFDWISSGMHKSVMSTVPEERPSLARASPAADSTRCESCDVMEMASSATNNVPRQHAPDNDGERKELKQVPLR